MRRRVAPPDQLLALAAAQSGVLSSAQAAALDFPLRCVDRLVAQRHWTRLAAGLYHVAPGNPSWLGLAWGGILLGGPRARLGFGAAGWLWKLLPDEPSTITVLVPTGNGVASRGPWIFRRELASTRDQRSPGDPPRTTIEDTVIDLCREVGPRGVLELVTKAVQTRRTTAARLLSRIEERDRVSHRRYLRDILGDVVEGAQSALELRYLKDVERAHGLPRGTRRSARLVRFATCLPTLPRSSPSCVMISEFGGDHTAKSRS